MNDWLSIDKFSLDICLTATKPIDNSYNNKHTIDNNNKKHNKSDSHSNKFDWRQFVTSLHQVIYTYKLAGCSITLSVFQSYIKCISQNIDNIYTIIIIIFKIFMKSEQRYSETL